jgi:hypothetical protein
MELLPEVIREWAENELQEHLSIEPYEVIKERVKRVSLVGKRARSLSEALGAIDSRDHWAIAMRLPGNASSLAEWTHEWAETKSFVERLKEETKFLTALAAATAACKPSRKRPSTVKSYLVIQDIAAIFEWCSGVEATRRVNNENNEEYGPFYEFAAALWPVIFGKGDDGLPAAIKNFASYRERGGRALIANMAIRHPEWRLFER